jgi:2,4-dienoyl-CoA reductase-like NADH-dependent reductase (Old Yellow Enzyme family)
MAADDPLFSPLQLGPLRLRNRFIKSATNEGMAKGGVPSRALVKHHADIAAGGAAMTTVAYCAVSADGRTFVDQIHLDDAATSHLRVLTDAVHAHGAAACAQITHGGAFTFLPGLSSRYPLSASGGFNPPGVLSGRLFKTAMTEADMQRVAEEFAAAARRARDAGFDAVEIHMGHGYLLSQFLSPAYNHRRDAYGGAVEARARFPLQVLRRVLDAVGRDLAVTCKIGVTEGKRGFPARRHGMRSPLAGAASGARGRAPAGAEWRHERGGAMGHLRQSHAARGRGSGRQPHRALRRAPAAALRPEDRVPRAVLSGALAPGAGGGAHAIGLPRRGEVAGGSATRDCGGL